MSRTGDFIYLRTMGYLDIDRDTNQVRTFVCVNTLVAEHEGKRLIQEMKKRFTIMIQETEISSNEPDTPAVENPDQLERAIISLITNLQHRNDFDCSVSLDGTVSEVDTMSEGPDCDSRSVKSPPLELIPPKHSSIRTSIVRSIDVVGSSVKNGPDDSDDEEDRPPSTCSTTTGQQMDEPSDGIITSNRMHMSPHRTTPVIQVSCLARVLFLLLSFGTLAK